MKILVDVFFFNDTATTEIYTLSLHDALPIFSRAKVARRRTVVVASRLNVGRTRKSSCRSASRAAVVSKRSEEHTSELQSRQYLVCRLLLGQKRELPSRISSWNQ